MPDQSDEQIKLGKIADALTPENPIQSEQFLRGRETTLDSLVSELSTFHSIPFVFGNRGVGKTSLAKTAALVVTPSDRKPIYWACAPGNKLLNVLRSICIDILNLAISKKATKTGGWNFDLNLSLNPSIKLSFNNDLPNVPQFESIDDAFMLVRDLDSLIPESRKTVIILDELEELLEEDRGDLAYFIKQLGDQEIGFRFLLVGIAQNVHELIGAHKSVPRYIKEVSLEPLNPQNLIDIVSYASAQVDVDVSEDYLYRIAIIGNGYPHFAHLMGKHLLIEAVMNLSDSVTYDVYKLGVEAAVEGSIQELKIAYEQATQRPDSHYKHLIWALAHGNTVDVSLDEWRKMYSDLCSKSSWTEASQTQVNYAIGNFKKAVYGEIVVNTPARYGHTASRRSFRRFSETLMRGHVRLQAEAEGVTLGVGDSRAIM